MKNSIWLLVLAFAIAGCSGTHDANTGEFSQTSGVIYPLAVGNTWRYSHITLDENNNITNQSSSTTTIITDVISNGQHYFTDKVSSFQNRSDGLWVFPDTLGFLLLKYPCHSGEYYISPVLNSSGGFDTLKATVLSVNERVSVPAGAFQCIQYRIVFADAYETDTTYYYASPNVGLIRTEQKQFITTISEKTRLVDDLLEYHLEK